MSHDIDRKKCVKATPLWILHQLMVSNYIRLCFVLFSDFFSFQVLQTSFHHAHPWRPKSNRYQIPFAFVQQSNFVFCWQFRRINHWKYCDNNQIAEWQNAKTLSLLLSPQPFDVRHTYLFNVVSSYRHGSILHWFHKCKAHLPATDTDAHRTHWNSCSCRSFYLHSFYFVLLKTLISLLWFVFGHLTILFGICYLMIKWIPVKRATQTWDEYNELQRYTKIQHQYRFRCLNTLEYCVWNEYNWIVSRCSWCSDGDVTHI